MAKQEREKEIHNNQISILHQRMVAIRTENEHLKEEMHEIFFSSQPDSNGDPAFGSAPSTIRDIERLEMLETIRTKPDGIQPTTSIDSQDTINDSDIMDKLLRFGHTQSDIQNAMNMVIDKQNINTMENDFYPQKSISDLEEKFNELQDLYDFAQREITKFKKECKELRR